MHARVTFSKGGAAGEEVARYVRETILPKARALDGFKGILDLTDPGTGDGLTVTLWDTEAAMNASEEPADDMRSGATRVLGGEIVEVKRFPVSTIEIDA